MTNPEAPAPPRGARPAWQAALREYRPNWGTLAVGWAGFLLGVVGALPTEPAHLASGAALGQDHGEPLAAPRSTPEARLLPTAHADLAGITLGDWHETDPNAAARLDAPVRWTLLGDPEERSQALIVRVVTSAADLTLTQADAGQQDPDFESQLTLRPRQLVLTVRLPAPNLLAFTAEGLGVPAAAAADGSDTPPDPATQEQDQEQEEAYGAHPDMLTLGQRGDVLWIVHTKALGADAVDALLDHLGAKRRDQAVIDNEDAPVRVYRFDESGGAGASPLWSLAPGYDEAFRETGSLHLDQPLLLIHRAPSDALEPKP